MAVSQSWTAWSPGILLTPRAPQEVAFWVVWLCPVGHVASARGRAIKHCQKWRPILKTQVSLSLAGQIFSRLKVQRRCLIFFSPYSALLLPSSPVVAVQLLSPLRSHRLQHTRPPCPLLSPRVCPNLINTQKFSLSNGWSDWRSHFAEVREELKAASEIAFIDYH